MSSLSIGVKAIGRRQFLKAGAAVGAAASLFPWLNRAGAQTKPKSKLILLFTPHGTVFNNWRPSGSGRNFTLSRILTPLAAHKDRLVICDGLALPHGTAYYLPHTYTMASLWTGGAIDTSTSLFCRADHNQCYGWSTGQSVDQWIAQQMPVGETPYRSLELGTYCGGLAPNTRMIYRAQRTPLSPLDTPQLAFDVLFGTLAADATARARKRSVLDAALADLGSRRGSLSVEDRARLDAHAAALRELETHLQAGATSCNVPGRPALVNSETAMDRQSDLLAAALGCGMTRVASLQLRVADNDNTLYPWLGLTTGGHHFLTHDSSGPAQEMLTKVYTWYAGRVAYLLDRLAATPDPAGGSVLDSTLVVWGSELGTGWSHDNGNVPFILAGGANVLQGGQYVTFPSGQTHHRVLVTALHCMGFRNLQQYGSVDKGTGPLAGVVV